MTTETIDLRTARDELRVRLLLALPDYGVTRIPAATPAGVPSDVHPSLDLYDSVKPDTDYDAEAVLTWVLDYFDNAMAAQSKVVREVSVLEAMEHQATVDQAQLETSNAAGVVTTAADLVVYLRGVAGVLRRSLSLSEQWDLARTIEGTADQLTATMTALVAQYPELSPVLAAPAPGLVLPGDGR